MSMGFSKLSSMQLYGCEPFVVDVEVDISTGLNSFSIVGLPDKATEEAKDRMSAAIKNSGFDSPKSKNQRIVISLAPAELRKEGANFDLAMALAYLLAVDDMRFDPVGKMFLGELSLDGMVRSVKAVLPLVIAAKNKGIKEIYLPESNREEAAVIEGIDIFPVTHLKEIIEHLNEKKGETAAGKTRRYITPLVVEPLGEFVSMYETDMKEVKGQEGAKRALEIAAAGGHNVMLYGPPGTGKTMLAKAFATILPLLTFEEVLEVTTIHSSVRETGGLIRRPPFRAPHHSVTHPAFVGGGIYPKPGEMTLAHRGVLFMDEFPEFDGHIVESLRQPLEDGTITVTRLKHSITFPSDFILLGSMNPCPCGFRNSSFKGCVCSHAAFERYQRKISGPIVDRIELWSQVAEVEYKKLGSIEKGEESAKIRERVEQARSTQRKRFADYSISLNAQIDAKDIAVFCPLSDVCRALLEESSSSLHLSARSYHKIIKLARTIADLGEAEEIEESHLLEAFQYRLKQ
jgi:magnesium chelatase family protein